MSWMFNKCGYNAMTHLYTEIINGTDYILNLDTSNVENMHCMFAFCGYNAMTELHLGSSFNTGNVTDMSRMFWNCGYNAMIELHLGSNFTKIASTNTDMFTNCGTNQSATIYIPQPIYNNETSAYLDATHKNTIDISSETNARFAYELPDNNLNIKFTNYTVKEDNNNNKYLLGIEVGTTINELLENIETNGTINIYKDSNQIEDETTVLCTGMKIKIYLDDMEEEYTIGVKGDINGDGEITSIDAYWSLSYAVETNETIPIYLCDINNDEKLTSIDALLILQHLVGINKL